MKQVFFVALFGLSFAPEVDPFAAGQDVFIEAAKNGDVVGVEWGIRFGMEFDAPGKFKMTPLMWAAHHGHTGVANLLIKAKAGIDKRDRDSETALHHAAIFGHVGVVRLLLNSNASVDLKDDNGDTPLHDATSKKHVGVVKLLLEAKANKFIKNGEGLNPLEYAGGLNAEIDAMLKDAPLNRALNNKDPPSKSAQDEKSLLEKKNRLLAAAENDDIEAVRELLEEGIPAGGSKERTSDGDLLLSTHKTALHAAVMQKNIGMVRLLLDHGAEIDAYFKNMQQSYTALHLSILSYNDESPITKLLLDRGASIYMKWNGRMDACAIAQDNGMETTERWIREVHTENMRKRNIEA